MKLSRFFAPGMNGPMANLGLLVLRVWLGVSVASVVARVSAANLP